LNRRRDQSNYTAMNITIFGLGAMGSIYAALFADAGHEVSAVDPWQEHTNAILNKGLRVNGASGDRTVNSIRIIESPDALDSADLYIVATKSGGVASAAKAIAPMLASGSHVLTIQNGLGAGERIAQYIPEQHILIGVAEGFGASVVEPGYVQHTAMNKIRIGSFLPGNKATVDSVTSVWKEAGFNSSAYEDIAQLIWEKFICNVAYSAPCTVFEKTVAELVADPNGLAVSQTCALEAWQVARAKGVNLCFENPIEYIAEFAKRVGNAKPSLYLDHLARRPSEIDAINGMVPVVAESVNLKAPYNEVLTHIIQAREAAWKDPVASD